MIQYRPYIVFRKMGHDNEPYKVMLTNVIADPMYVALWLSRQITSESGDVIDIGIDKIEVEEEQNG